MSKGDEHVCSLSFGRKFNSQQLLSEMFFDIIGILHSIEVESECTFPFQYIIIFPKYQSSEYPRYTAGAGRHMRPLNLLYEI